MSTIFQAYRDLSEADSLPPPSDLTANHHGPVSGVIEGEKPSEHVYRIAHHVSKLANDSGDKKMHALASTLHHAIADAHGHGRINGQKWASEAGEDTHRAIADKHDEKAG